MDGYDFPGQPLDEEHQAPELDPSSLPEVPDDGMFQADEPVSIETMGGTIPPGRPSDSQEEA